MRTWLRSLVNAVLGKVPGKPAGPIQQLILAMDADFSYRHEPAREALPTFVRTPQRKRTLKEQEYMRYLFVAALVTCLTGEVGQALAYTCNNNYYVNSSGHLVHSPSCGQEHEKRTAECRDGSVSFSEHHRGTCSYHGSVAHWD